MYLAMRNVKETLLIFFSQARVGKTNLYWKRGGVTVDLLP